MQNILPVIIFAQFMRFLASKDFFSSENLYNRAERFFIRVFYNLTYLRILVERFLNDKKSLIIQRLGLEAEILENGDYHIPVFLKGKTYYVLLKKKEYSFSIPLELEDKNGIIKKYGGPYLDFFFQDYLFEDFGLKDWDGNLLFGKLTEKKDTN